MSDKRKIFDKQGFLTPEAKSFVYDGFVKETRKIFSTAIEEHDKLVISSILKNLIGDIASEK